MEPIWAVSTEMFTFGHEKCVKIGIKLCVIYAAPPPNINMVSNNFRYQNRIKNIGSGFSFIRRKALDEDRPLFFWQQNNIELCSSFIESIVWKSFIHFQRFRKGKGLFAISHQQKKSLKLNSIQFSSVHWFSSFLLKSHEVQYLCSYGETWSSNFASQNWCDQRRISSAAPTDNSIDCCIGSG